MGKRPKKKPKTPRKHFKVKLERIAKHIGKIVDNSSVKDIQEVLLNAGLAYASVVHLKSVDQQGNIHYNPLNAMFGPIALKLATTDGIVSQTAGVAGLSILGISMIGGQIVKEIVDEASGYYIKKRDEPWEIDGKKIAI